MDELKDFFEDKAKAASAFWEVLWLLEALGLKENDTAHILRTGDVQKYIFKYGISDRELRR